MCDLPCGPIIHHGAETGEYLQLKKLRVVEFERIRERLDRLGLCGAAHAGHTHADIDRRLLSFVEKLRLQIDLPIGDRDQVRRDIGRKVPPLGFGNRERGQRPAALFFRKFRRTF